MLETLIVLWLTALPLMGSPGPATLSLAALGAAYGPVRSLPYLAGIVAGTSGVLVLIATGITALILALPALAFLITLAAAAYILYLAYRIATAPLPVAGAPETTPPAFAGGFFLALANPKAYAAIGAVYAGVSLSPIPLADAVAKCAALIPVIVVVNSAWLVFGAAFRSVMRHPRYGRLLNWAFAGLLIAAVVMALFAI